MPQLDPRYFSSQFFWIIVCFALFYICMHYFIVPRLRTILDTRNQVNDRNKTKAHMLTLEIQELKVATHNKIALLNQQVEEIKTSSDRKFQKFAQEALEKFNNEIKIAYDDTMSEIDKQKKILNEKTTNAFVESLAEKVIVKLTGGKL